MAKKEVDATQIVVEAHKAGKTKDDIANMLFAEGYPLSGINKIIKDSGVSFRRTGIRTWKFKAADLFAENPDATVDDMAKALEGTVKDPLYYVSGYYDVFKYMAQKMSS